MKNTGSHDITGDIPGGGNSMYKHPKMGLGLVYFSNRMKGRQEWREIILEQRAGVRPQ